MTQLNVQALEALEKANSVRMLRAADKRSIKSGDLDPVCVLKDPPDHWGSAKLGDLFLSIPRIGRQRANRLCAIENVSPARRLDALTERQRGVLAMQVALCWSAS